MKHQTEVMSTSAEHPERIVLGRERFPAVDGEPVVTTSAERYVMRGGRTPRLAIKEGDLFEAYKIEEIARTF